MQVFCLYSILSLALVLLYYLKILDLPRLPLIPQISNLFLAILEYSISLRKHCYYIEISLPNISVLSMQWPQVHFL
jgi:hypothetical protein